MRAAVLNSAMGNKPGVSLEVPELPPGTVVNLPPAASNGFDIEKAKQWWKTGQAIEAAGGNPGSDFNFGAALAAAAAGAAAGAAAAGVGAVLGAIAGVAVYVVKLITGDRPSQWDNAGPNVHWWFTNRAPQAYLEWLYDTNGTGVFRSVQDSARAYLAYLLTVENYVLWPGHSYYGGTADMDIGWHAFNGFDYETGGATIEQRDAFIRQYYADLGVDWDATVAQWDNFGRSSTIMMKRREVVGVQDEKPTDAGEDGTASTAAVGAGIAILAAFALLSPRN